MDEATPFKSRIDALLSNLPAIERALLEKAIDRAITAHRGHRRVSGEAYFLHLLAVAEILKDLNLDVNTITAAILHDVVEDTDVMLNDIQAEYGPEISRMVDGVTKMEKIGELQQVARSQQSQG